jgi:hypothetical protein
MCSHHDWNKYNLKVNSTARQQEAAPAGQKLKADSACTKLHAQKRPVRKGEITLKQMQRVMAVHAWSSVSAGNETRQEADMRAR